MPYRLSHYLFRHAGLFTLGALALLITNALQFFVPRVLGWFVDALGVAYGGTTLSEPHPPQTGLWAFFAAPLAALESWVKQQAIPSPSQVFFLLLGLALFAAAIRITSRLLIFRGGRVIEYEVRRELFDKLLALPPSFYRSTPTGDILSRASNDLTSVRLVFGPGLLNIVNTILVFVTGIPLLFAISPSLALISLSPFPVIVLISFFIMRKVFQANLLVQTKLAAISSRAEETISGITVVQAYRQERAFADRFAKDGEAYVAASMSLVRTRGLMGPLVGSIGGLGTALALYYGGARVIRGEMSLGDLLAFQTYLGMLTWPLTALGFVLSLVERGRAAFARIAEILRVVPSLAEPAQPLPMPESSALAIRDLRLRYGDALVLDGISCEIPEGSFLGIVGPTGSGKSTLVNALARLLEVPEGAIFLGGVDICQLSLRDVRNTIGLVPQDSFLFAESIAYNLAFGRRDKVSEEEIIEAAKLARFWQEIERFPKKLATEVGERGVQLSGGQKQRACLARAILASPKILILDDSLSAVDAETEAQILSELPKLARGRTMIIVSHRVATVRHAAQILVLDHGRVVEQGPHQELCAKNGHYATLERIQKLEATLAEAKP